VSAPRLAVNYSPALASLVAAGEVSIDVYKVPDWDDLIAAAGEGACYVHFPTDLGATSLGIDLARSVELMNRTGTCYLNAHVAPSRERFPDVAVGDVGAEARRAVAAALVADVEALAARRQVEQREAARRLAGDRAGEVIFLGYVDGELDSGRAVQSEVALAIRRLRPTVVLGHDPWKRYRLHPDHRHAGLLTCDAIVAARDPHFFREHGVAHHRPEHLLLFEADEPNHVEDVSGWVDHKLSALEAHESQFESTMHAVDASQLEPFRERIRTRLASHGAAFGFEAAERFARVSDI